MNYTIGVDLDNTIVSYDSLMYIIALELGLIDKDTKKSKKQIRHRIRQLRDGEKKWQELQAIVYGQRMDEAQLIRGVDKFFKLCQKNKVRVYVISHKTEFANYDSTKTNLRAASLNWMEKNKFFKDDELSLPKENIYFESTRAGKIERIKLLKCTHFIDDLEETFAYDSFPNKIQKILYDPHGEHSHLQKVLVFKSWEDINEYFFKSRE